MGAVDNGFVEEMVALMRGMGPVQVKRMFGGYGFFLDGLMFGVVVDNTLYLKAVGDAVEEFTAEGSEPFTYMRKGKEVALSYYQAPDEAMEDEEGMTLWAGKAFDCAIEAARKK